MFFDPVTSNDRIAGSSFDSSRSELFFKLTADQVMVFDWIAGSSQVRTPKHKRGLIFRHGYPAILRHLRLLTVVAFRALSVVHCGYTAMLRQPKLLTVVAFRVQVDNDLKNIFSCFFRRFQSVFDIYCCSQDHTGGYAVIQVKHLTDINLKLKNLKCSFLLCIAIFGISSENFSF